MFILLCLHQTLHIYCSHSMFVFFHQWKNHGGKFCKIRKENKGKFQQTVFPVSLKTTGQLAVRINETQSWICISNHRNLSSKLPSANLQTTTTHPWCFWEQCFHERDIDTVQINHSMLRWHSIIRHQETLTRKNAKIYSLRFHMGCSKFTRGYTKRPKISWNYFKFLIFSLLQI